MSRRRVIFLSARQSAVNKGTLVAPFRAPVTDRKCLSVLLLSQLIPGIVSTSKSLSLSASALFLLEAARVLFSRQLPTVFDTDSDPDNDRFSQHPKLIDSEPSLHHARVFTFAFTANQRVENRRSLKYNTLKDGWRRNGKLVARNLMRMACLQKDGYCS